MKLSIRGVFSILTFLTLLAFGILSLYNLAVKNSEGISIGQRLGGVTSPPSIEEVNVASFLKGKLQSQVEGKIEDHLPPRPWLIRLNNEIRYSLFHQLDNVLVGSNGELIEEGYLDEYCHRNIYLFLPQAKAWAAKVKRAQDLFSNRGQLFIYLISPSKASSYPEYFDGYFNCPSPRSQRNGLMRAYREVLDQAGVNYVDGTAWLMAHRYDYDADLFPRGGIHWSRMAASHTSLDIIDQIQKQFPTYNTPRFSISYSYSNAPMDTDSDLAELANLLFPRTHYPVFDVKLSFPLQVAKVCKPIGLAMVAGSFGHQIMNSLGEGGCINVDYFYYYSLRLDLAGPQGTASSTPVPENAFNRLNTDKVIIFEENEDLMTHSNHGKAFFEKILGDSK